MQHSCLCSTLKSLSHLLSTMLFLGLSESNLFDSPISFLHGMIQLVDIPAAFFLTFKNSPWSNQHLIIVPLVWLLQLQKFLLLYQSNKQSSTIDDLKSNTSIARHTYKNKQKKNHSYMYFTCPSKHTIVVKDKEERRRKTLIACCSNRPFLYFWIDWILFFY